MTAQQLPSWGMHATEYVHVQCDRLAFSLDVVIYERSQRELRTIICMMVTRPLNRYGVTGN